MNPSKPRKCPHCKQFFKPDTRTADRQRYCSAQACQQASHRKSQRGWSRKPENRKYFCGPIHRDRVYAWRESTRTGGGGGRKRGACYKMTVLRNRFPVKMLSPE